MELFDPGLSSASSDSLHISLGKSAISLSSSDFFLKRGHLRLNKVLHVSVLSNVKYYPDVRNGCYYQKEHLKIVR